MVLFIQTITTFDPSHSEVIQGDLDLILEAKEFMEALIERSIGPRNWKTIRLCVEAYLLALFHYGKLIDYQLMQETEGYIKQEPTDD